jgi:hypothetical protein
MFTKNFKNSPTLHEPALKLFKESKNYFIFNEKLDSLLTKHGFKHQSKGGFLNALRNYAQLHHGIVIPKSESVKASSKKSKLNKQGIDYLSGPRVQIHKMIYKEINQLGVNKSITLPSNNTVAIIKQHKTCGLSVVAMFEKDTKTFNTGLIRLQKEFGKNSIESKLLYNANIIEYIKTGICDTDIYVEFDSCGSVRSAKEFLKAKHKPQYWSLTTTKWTRGHRPLTSEETFNLFCQYVGGKDFKRKYVVREQFLDSEGSIMETFLINGVKYRSIEYKATKQSKDMRIFLNF